MPVQTYDIQGDCRPYRQRPYHRFQRGQAARPDAYQQLCHPFRNLPQAVKSALCLQWLQVKILGFLLLSKKGVYTARTAQQQYEETLVSSREGIALNKAKFYDDDRMISERINTGQHLNQILPDITASKSSVYRYFNKGYLSASKIDLPRAVH